MGGEFVDTNILVYAHDASAGPKRERAILLLEQLLRTQQGRLSTQVLMEFFVIVTSKIPRPIPSRTAIRIIRDFGTWHVFSPGVDDVAEGARIAEKYDIHFWDGMIVRAAGAFEASVIWSEDLNHGQRYEGITVRNPFFRE